MKTFEAKMNMILPLLVLSVIFLPSSPADAAGYTVKEKDSVYLYHALENKASLDEMLANKDIALLFEKDESLESSLPVSVRSSFSSRKSELLDPALFEIALNELIQKQNSTTKEAEKAIKRVSGKSELGSVLLGNNLGKLEFELVQIKGLQALLNSLIPKTTNVALKLQIRDQIDVLKNTQKKIEALLYQKEKDFSFLGWLVATI